jgi:threonine/homoserine/homoserine lactone efflux protein
VALGLAALFAAFVGRGLSRRSSGIGAAYLLYLAWGAFRAPVDAAAGARGRLRRPTAGGCTGAAW